MRILKGEYEQVGMSYSTITDIINQTENIDSNLNKLLLDLADRFKQAEREFEAVQKAYENAKNKEREAVRELNNVLEFWLKRTKEDVYIKRIVEGNKLYLLSENSTEINDIELL